MPPRNQRQYLPLNERIKDGRILAVNKRTQNGLIYLRCSTKHCRGTAKKLANGEIIVSRAHSSICFEDSKCQLKADFLCALKTALKRNFWKLKVLYETVAAMYPPDIKVLLPFNGIKSSLKNWRKCMFPPNPTALEEMARQLAQPECSRLLEYDVGRLVCQRITDALGKIHLLLYDPEFVRDEFRNVLRLLIDATFQSTPRLTDVYQMLTVLGVIYDHALPFVHILMASKTEAAYTAVLNAVCNLINSAGVTIIMTDFEQALRNASKAAFPNAHITGCNVHYDRALLKKINKLRLSAHLREDEAAKMFLKKVMALAFLPEHCIEAEYNTLKNALPLPLKALFQAFCTYYERQWLRVVKPAGFSVFGLSRRTNNVTESYNSVLADELGLHPSAWTFLAWKLLYSDDITAAEFLDIAANLKGHIRQRLAIIATDPEEEELEMEEIAANVPADDDPDYEADIFDGLRFDEHEGHEIDERIESNDDELDQSDHESRSSDHEDDNGLNDPVFRAFRDEAQEAAAARETREGHEELEVREGPMTRAARRARELRAAREPDLMQIETAMQRPGAQETAARDVEEARPENGLQEELAREAERRVIEEDLAPREARTQTVVQEVLARQAQRRAVEEELAAREARAEIIIQEELARQARAEIIIQEELARQARAEIIIQEELAREAREQRAARRAQDELEARRAQENREARRAQEDLEARRAQEDLEARRAQEDLEARRAQEVIPIDDQNIMVVDITGDTDSDDGQENIGPHQQIDNVEAEQEQRETVSRSRKKHLRKKKNRALKLQNGCVLPRRIKYRRRNARPPASAQAPDQAQAQAPDQAQAQVVAPVAAPVAAPIAAPVAAPIAAPVAAPIAAPVAAPIAAPVAAPIAAPDAPPIAAPDEIEAPTCVICLTNDITRTFVPCGHSCCCEECSKILIRGHLCPKWCPKCREPFTAVIRTYTET